MTRRNWLSSLSAGLSWLLGRRALALDSWQLETLRLINEERNEANAREMAFHGAILKFRDPLAWDGRLAECAQWWCDALTRSGWFDHFGTLNERGYLMNPVTGKQLSRVWLPTFQPDRLTFWGYRLRHMGVEGWEASSENGVTLKRVTALGVVEAWVGSGWHIDPRQATRHYRNLIEPNWTHFGVASAAWQSGQRSVFGEFLGVSS